METSVLGAYTNARAELQLLVGVEKNGVVVLAHNDTSAVVTVGAAESPHPLECRRYVQRRRRYPLGQW